MYNIHEKMEGYKNNLTQTKMTLIQHTKHKCCIPYDIVEVLTAGG